MKEDEARARRMSLSNRAMEAREVRAAFRKVRKFVRQRKKRRTSRRRETFSGSRGRSSGGGWSRESRVDCSAAAGEMGRVEGEEGEEDDVRCGVNCCTRLTRFSRHPRSYAAWQREVSSDTRWSRWGSQKIVDAEVVNLT